MDPPAAPRPSPATSPADPVCANPNTNRHMDKLLITGGAASHGEVRISGAKNAALPILAATLLTAEPVTLSNVPRLRDITTTMALLGRMGVRLAQGRATGRCAVDAGAPSPASPRPTSWSRPCAPRSWSWGPWWRASARPTSPCPAAAPSARARSTCTSRACGPWARRSAVENGYIRARAGRLRGARLVMEMVSVTGTENLMMAAALAEGETLIENAAREPEVVDLADFLNAWARSIEGAGTDTIRIQGVDAPRRRQYRGHARSHRDRDLSGGRGHDRRAGAGLRHPPGLPGLRAARSCARPGPRSRSGRTGSSSTWGGGARGRWTSTRPPTRPSPPTCRPSSAP